MEMVVAFDRHAAEVEARGHSANAVIGFEYHGLMAVAGQLVGHGKAHRAGADGRCARS